MFLIPVFLSGEEAGLSPEIDPAVKEADQYLVLAKDFVSLA